MYRFLISILLFTVLTSHSHAEYMEGGISIQGGFFPIGTTFSGDINAIAQTITISPTDIWETPYVTVESEYLLPGSYTRNFAVPGGGNLSRSATIPTGTTGAYFVVEFQGEYYQIFNAWNVSIDGLTYSNEPIAGDVWIGGPYNGRRTVYEFMVTDEPPPPPPELDVTITLNTGPTYECSIPGGHNVFGFDASVVESSGAVLDYVQWDLDGVILGQGLSYTEFAPSGIFVSLGSHELTATAFAVGGGSVSASRTLNVNDTTAPDLEIQFQDLLGNPVSIASPGDYQVRYIATDICDDNVDVSGTATPVMEVFDGDMINVISGNEVNLPTTAIRVNATAVDDSGRSNSSSAVLQIQ